MPFGWSLLSLFWRVTFVLPVCGETTVSWLTTGTAAPLCSLQIRSIRGISGFSFFLLFHPLCLSCRMTGQGQGRDISWMLHCALPCMVHRGGGERMKRAVGQIWLLCHATTQKTDSWWRSGLRNTQVGGGRAVSFPSTSLWNTWCSIWFLFCLEVFFTVGKKPCIYYFASLFSMLNLDQ